MKRAPLTSVIYNSSSQIRHTHTKKKTTHTSVKWESAQFVIKPPTVSLTRTLFAKKTDTFNGSRIYLDALN